MRMVGPGLDAVEAEKRREAVARRGRARRVRIADDIQRQRLVRPVGRPPDPRLGPVLDAHRREVDDRFGRGRPGRLRTLPGTGALSIAPALSRAWHLRRRGRDLQPPRTERRDTARPQLQQRAPFQQALAAL